MTGQYKQQKFESEKSKTKIRFLEGPSKSSDLGSHMATIPLHPQMPFLLRGETEISLSFCKATTLIKLGPHLYDPVSLQKPPIDLASKYNHEGDLGINIQIWGTTIQSIALCKNQISLVALCLFLFFFFSYMICHGLGKENIRT
jgi:hypothetical protein